MRKRPNSLDVARLADVSQATVSYVLSNRADKAISDDTRARVLKAAETLGYMPNRLADGILRGKTSTIGVIMPDFAHSFYSHLLLGLESALAEAGYRILIAHNRNHADYERNQVRMLMEHRIDGLVAVADEATVREMPTWVGEVTRIGVQVCIVDDTSLDGVVDTVVSNDVMGARLAVEHLLELGHRRIVFLGGSEGTTSSQDRRKGYEQALKLHGVVPDPNLFLGTSYRPDVAPDLAPFLEGDQPATAVFAVSDGLMGQAIMALNERGVPPDRHPACVGYGNLEFASYLSMSTVEQYPVEIGKAAAERLLKRLEGEDSEPATIRIAPTLIARGSSRPPVRLH